ncbi:MAG: pilus assembly protein PilP [Cardiobacteriaceae bacterium]|nr:pilus assembly protein PilP [Cardiobacteriaceae bacterium]
MQNKNTLYKLITLQAIILFSTGFMGNNPESEVTQFVKDIENNSKPNPNLDLGPLPVNQEYHPYVYAADSADPFALKSFVVDASIPEDSNKNVCADDDCGDGAPAPHVKYFLENYDLSQLWMVGTILNKNQRRAALIQTPDAGIVNTVQGEYMGKNNGLIISIKPDHVVVQEKHRVPRGWQNRMAILELFTY